MEDLTGRTFNYLTVVSFSHFDKKKNSYWVCRCKCGNYKTVRRNHLLSGGVQSCGCILKEARGLLKNGWKTHGKWSENHRLNKIWNGMLYRCRSEKHKHYKDYGGRGISVCDEWLPENNGCCNFFEWAYENGYKENLTIDRIDVNGNYCPENCRWVDMKAQQSNKRNNHYITYKGQTKTLSQWEKETGIKLKGRLKYGYSIEDSFELPKGYLRKAKRITYCNQTKTVSEWSELCGIPKSTLRRRYDLNWGLEKVFMKGDSVWVL